MIVPDANLLIYAMNADSDQHAPAWEWWESTQRGQERVGLTWQVLLAYIRIMTHPRLMPRPLPLAQAVADVRAWMESPITDVLLPGREHLHVMERLLTDAGLGGELASDAHLAALALENGGTVYTADADFARFDKVRWVNPLAV
jgi:toxin-antitoxin system PIN domain toxin